MKIFKESAFGIQWAPSPTIGSFQKMGNFSLNSLKESLPKCIWQQKNRIRKKMFFFSREKKHKKFWGCFETPFFSLWQWFFLMGVVVLTLIINANEDQRKIFTCGKLLKKEFEVGEPSAQLKEQPSQLFLRSTQKIFIT